MVLTVEKDWDSGQYICHRCHKHFEAYSMEFTGLYCTDCTLEAGEGDSRWCGIQCKMGDGCDGGC